MTEDTEHENHIQPETAPIPAAGEPASRTPAPGPPVLSQDDEEVIRKRLQQLGYLD